MLSWWLVVVVVGRRDDWSSWCLIVMMIDRQVVGCLGHGGGAGGRDSSPRVCDGDGRNYQEATVLGLL